MSLRDVRAVLTALVIVASLLSPTTSAFDYAEYRSDTGIPVLDDRPYLRPCLVLDITLPVEAGGVNGVHRAVPFDCEGLLRVAVAWHQGPTGVQGMMEYRTALSNTTAAVQDNYHDVRGGLQSVAMSQAARHVPLNLLSSLAAWLWPASVPDARAIPGAIFSWELPPDEVSFRATWDISYPLHDCRSAYGSITAEAKGAHVAAVDLASLLLAACAIGETPPTPVTPSGRDLDIESANVARWVAALLVELQPSVALPLAPALDALLQFPAPPPIAAFALPPLDSGAPLSSGPNAGADAAPGRDAFATRGSAETAASPTDSQASAAFDDRIVTPAAVVGAHAEGPAISQAENTQETERRTASPAPRGDRLSHPEAGLSSDPASPRGPDAMSAPTGPSTATERTAAPGQPDATRPPARAASETFRAPQPPPVLPALVAATAIGSLLVVLFSLYQRIHRPEALDHPGRRALHAACKELGAPATAGELAARTGMDRKTAEYHLLYLARLGSLTAHVLPDAPRRYALPIVRVVRETASVDERLLAALRARPGASAPELSDSLGITRPRADRHMKGLALVGMVESRVERGTRVYFLACPPQEDRPQRRLGVD